MTFLIEQPVICSIQRETAGAVNTMVTCASVARLSCQFERGACVTRRNTSSSDLTAGSC